VINGDAPLSHDLLKVSIGHGVTDVKKHSVQDHGLGVVHAFEINRHSAQLAYSFPSKCSAASDGHLKAQKFATEPAKRRSIWEKDAESYLALSQLEPVAETVDFPDFRRAMVEKKREVTPGGHWFFGGGRSKVLYRLPERFTTLV
jgi:hypothetical protein